MVEFYRSYGPLSGSYDLMAPFLGLTKFDTIQTRHDFYVFGFSVIAFRSYSCQSIKHKFDLDRLIIILINI